MHVFALPSCAYTSLHAMIYMYQILSAGETKGFGQNSVDGDTTYFTRQQVAREQTKANETLNQMMESEKDARKKRTQVIHVSCEVEVAMVLNKKYHIVDGCKLIKLGVNLLIGVLHHQVHNQSLVYHQHHNIHGLVIIHHQIILDEVKFYTGGVSRVIDIISKNTLIKFGVKKSNNQDEKKDAASDKILFVPKKRQYNLEIQLKRLKSKGEQLKEDTVSTNESKCNTELLLN